jgi:hypothetical protein
VCMHVCMCVVCVCVCVCVCVTSILAPCVCACAWLLLHNALTLICMYVYTCLFVCVLVFVRVFNGSTLKKLSQGIVSDLETSMMCMMVR